MTGIGYKGDLRELLDEAAPQVRIDGNRIEYYHQLGLGRGHQRSWSPVDSPSESDYRCDWRAGRMALEFGLEGRLGSIPSVTLQ